MNTCVLRQCDSGLCSIAFVLELRTLELVQSYRLLDDGSEDGTDDNDADPLVWKLLADSKLAALEFDEARKLYRRSSEQLKLLFQKGGERLKKAEKPHVHFYHYLDALSRDASISRFRYDFSQADADYKESLRELNENCKILMERLQKPKRNNRQARMIPSWMSCFKATDATRKGMNDSGGQSGADAGEGGACAKFFEELTDETQVQSALVALLDVAYQTLSEIAFYQFLFFFHWRQIAPKEYTRAQKFIWQAAECLSYLELWHKEKHEHQLTIDFLVERRKLARYASILCCTRKLAEAGEEDLKFEDPEAFLSSLEPLEWEPLQKKIIADKDKHDIGYLSWGSPDTGEPERGAQTEPSHRVGGENIAGEVAEERAPASTTLPVEVDWIRGLKEEECVRSDQYDYHLAKMDYGWLLYLTKHYTKAEREWTACLRYFSAENQLYSEACLWVQSYLAELKCKQGNNEDAKKDYQTLSLKYKLKFREPTLGYANVLFKLAKCHEAGNAEDAYGCYFEGFQAYWKYVNVSSKDGPEYPDNLGNTLEQMDMLEGVSDFLLRGYGHLCQVPSQVLQYSIIVQLWKDYCQRTFNGEARASNVLEPLERNTTLQTKRTDAPSLISKLSRGHLFKLMGVIREAHDEEEQAGMTFVVDHGDKKTWEQDYEDAVEMYDAAQSDAWKALKRIMNDSAGESQYQEAGQRDSSLTESVDDPIINNPSRLWEIYMKAGRGLAHTKMLQRKFAEAVEELRKSVVGVQLEPLKDKLNVKGREAMLHRKMELASLQKLVGNYEDAKQLFKGCIEELGQSTSEEDKKRMYWTRVKLSQVLEYLGEFDLAEKYYRMFKAYMDKNMSSDNEIKSSDSRKYVIGTKLGHANLYNVRGNYAQAVAYIESAREDCEKYYRKESVVSMVVLGREAFIKQCAAEHEKAEELHYKVVNWCERRFGKRNPLYANFLLNLSTCLAESAELAKAENKSRQEGAIGNPLDDEETRLKFSRAESFAQKALDTIKEIYGEKLFGYRGSFLEVFLCVYLVKKRIPHAARQAFQEIYESEKTDQILPKLYRALLHIIQGWLHWEDRKFEEALEEARKAQGIAEKMNGILVRALRLESYALLGQSGSTKDEALKAINEAFRIAKLCYGVENGRTKQIKEEVRFVSEAEEADLRTATFEAKIQSMRIAEVKGFGRFVETHGAMFKVSLEE